MVPTAGSKEVVGVIGESHKMEERGEEGGLLMAVCLRVVKVGCWVAVLATLTALTVRLRTGGGVGEALVNTVVVNHSANSSSCEGTTVSARGRGW